MRRLPKLGLVVVALWVAATTMPVVQATTTRRYRRTAKDPIVCELSLNAVLNQDGTHSEFFSCSLFLVDDNDNMATEEGTYAIQPPSNIFTEHKRQLLRRGQPVCLEIRGGEVTEDEIVLPNDDAAAVSVASCPQRHGRSLARRPDSTGSFMAVMIRISTADAEPVYSKDQLYDYLFHETRLSAKRQFEQCSGGALTMRDDPNLGVIDVRLDSTTAQGNSNKALMNLAEAQVNEQYKGLLGGQTIRNHADALMFVLPKGTGSWAAFATVAGKSSAYNDKWGGYLGAIMHELGHNLGLRHAFENGKEYEDRSGYMGSAPQRVMYPERCYNGHNFQTLQWYRDRFLKVEPEIPRLVKMAGFVDYASTASDEYVVVQVGTLFLHFNRAVSFNKDSAEMRDSVILVRERSDGTDMLNGLAVGQSHSETIGGEDVTIAVCSVEMGRSSGVIYMLVSIGYGDSLCFATPEVPSKANPNPAPRPSPKPTDKPILPSPFPGRSGPTSPSQPTPRVPAPPVPTPPVPTPPVPVPSPKDSPRPERADGETEGSRFGSITSAPTIVVVEPPRGEDIPDSPSSPSLVAPSPAPSSITYEDEEDYNGILTQAQSLDEGPKMSAHAVFLIVMMLLFCCCCCMFLSRRYRLVWDEDDSLGGDLVEVGSDIVAIKRCQAFDNSAETETLASDDGSMSGLEEYENFPDEAKPKESGRVSRHVVRNFLFQPKQPNGEDWTRALDYWTEPSSSVPSRPPPPAPLRVSPVGKTAPRASRRVNRPDRQSFQPVVVQSWRLPPPSWHDVELDPLQVEPSQPVERRDPPRHSGIDGPSAMQTNESPDSAYNFSSVVAQTDRRREARRPEPNDWTIL